MKNNYIKKIYTQFKENFNYTIKLSGVLSLFIIVCYFILTIILITLNFNDLFGTIIILLVIWLIISFIFPFFYSFNVTNEILLNTVNEKNKCLSIFFSMRRMGKSRIAKSALNIWRHLGFAYLIYFGVVILTDVIYVGISRVINDPTGIYNVILEMQAIISDTSLSPDMIIDQLNQLLLVRESTLHLFKGIVSFISFGAGFFYFLHSLTKSFLNYYAIHKTLSYNTALIYYILRKEMKKNKAFDYNKVYYKLLFPYYIAAPIIYSLVYLLMLFYLPQTQITVIVLTSMVVTIILLLPFIPILFTHNYFYSRELRLYLYYVMIEALESSIEKESFVKYGDNLMDQKMSETAVNFGKGLIEGYRNFIKENEEEILKFKDSNPYQFNYVQDYISFRVNTENEEYMKIFDEGLKGKQGIDK